jgi:hypothetical protein
VRRRGDCSSHFGRNRDCLPVKQRINLHPLG